MAALKNALGEGCLYVYIYVFIWFWISRSWSSSFVIQKGGNFKIIFLVPYPIIYNPGCHRGDFEKHIQISRQQKQKQKTKHNDISQMFPYQLTSIYIISTCADTIDMHGTTHTLLRNKRCMLDEMTRWNASKFAIFYTTKTQSCFLHFFPNECLGLCRHRPGHSVGGKSKVAQNEKWKK